MKLLKNLFLILFILACLGEAATHARKLFASDAHRFAVFAQAVPPAQTSFRIVKYSGGRVTVLHAGVAYSAQCVQLIARDTPADCSELAAQVGRSIPQTPPHASQLNVPTFDMTGNLLFYRGTSLFFPAKSYTLELRIEQAIPDSR